VNTTADGVTVRDFVLDDSAATLSVFLDAITVTASADYSPEQVAAWSAPQDRTVKDWGLSRASINTIVAVVDGRIAGFSDVNGDGYIHMMFVAPQVARRGVGGELLAEAERRAKTLGATTLSTNASITARPFFEHHGFDVVTEQYPVIRGVSLINHHMIKLLGDHQASPAAGATG
jgi:putative acetyltransferase